jgi:SAM-dependent methyltransferase
MRFAELPPTVERRVVRRVVGQFMRPHGVGGTLAGWVMAHRSSNVRRNLWIVSLLEVQPIDRVLEIGFGPGIAIAELSRLAFRGTVLGLDHSEVMVRQAKRRNAAAVRAGQVDLRLGSAEALPDFGEPVDKILAVNSMGFWAEPVVRLEQLRSRLRPGGAIAIASQPRGPRAARATTEQTALEIETALAEAGFSGSRVGTLGLDPPVVAVVAVSEPASNDRDAATL